MAATLCGSPMYMAPEGKLRVVVQFMKCIESYFACKMMVMMMTMESLCGSNFVYYNYSVV